MENSEMKQALNDVEQLERIIFYYENLKHSNDLNISSGLDPLQTLSKTTFNNAKNSIIKELKKELNSIKDAIKIGKD